MDGHWAAKPADSILGISMGEVLARFCFMTIVLGCVSRMVRGRLGPYLLVISIIVKDL